MTRGAFLRRAGPADAPAVVELERAASLHPWSETQVAEELARSPPDEVLVLAGHGPLVAYCALRIVLDEAQVMNLAVRPDARRHGFGRFLLGVALARAARVGARRALLEVRARNLAAQALYVQCGFVPIGRRRHYYRDPVDDALVLAREAGAERS